MSDGLILLGDYLAKAEGGEKSGHKYKERQGTPGHYQYTYDQPGAGASVLGQTASGQPIQATQRGPHSVKEWGEVLVGKTTPGHEDQAPSHLEHEGKHWVRAGYNTDTNTVGYHEYQPQRHIMDPAQGFAHEAMPLDTKSVPGGVFQMWGMPQSQGGNLPDEINDPHHGKLTVRGHNSDSGYTLYHKEVHNPGWNKPAGAQQPGAPQAGQPGAPLPGGGASTPPGAMNQNTPPTAKAPVPPNQQQKPGAVPPGGGQPPRPGSSPQAPLTGGGPPMAPRPPVPPQAGPAAAPRPAGTPAGGMGPQQPPPAQHTTPPAPQAPPVQGGGPAPAGPPQQPMQPAQGAAPRPLAPPAQPAKPGVGQKPYEKSMAGLDALGDYLEKAGHKYIKREGTPGNYTYTYQTPGGRSVSVPSMGAQQTEAGHKQKLEDAPVGSTVTFLTSGVYPKGTKITKTSDGAWRYPRKPGEPAARAGEEGGDNASLDFINRMQADGTLSAIEKPQGASARGGGESRKVGKVTITATQGKTGQWSAQVHPVEGSKAPPLPGASGATAQEALDRTEKMVRDAGGGGDEPARASYETKEWLQDRRNMLMEGMAKLSGRKNPDEDDKANLKALAKEFKEVVAKLGEAGKEKKPPTPQISAPWSPHGAQLPSGEEATKEKPGATEKEEWDPHDTSDLRDVEGAPAHAQPPTGEATKEAVPLPKALGSLAEKAGVTIELTQKGKEKVYVIKRHGEQWSHSYATAKGASAAIRHGLENGQLGSKLASHTGRGGWEDNRTGGYGAANFSPAHGYYSYRMPMGGGKIEVTYSPNSGSGHKTWTVGTSAEAKKTAAEHHAKLVGLKKSLEGLDALGDYLEKADKIPGGLADRKKPGDFDPKALAQGVKVEREHTRDPAVAREIAMDHLTEDSDYYTKLARMEAKKSERPSDVESQIEALFERDPSPDDSKVHALAGKLGMEVDDLEERIYAMAAKRMDKCGMAKGDLTPQKARQILHDGTVHGNPITDQQRKYFGAVASGSARKGMEKSMRTGLEALSEYLTKSEDPMPDNKCEMGYGKSKELGGSPDGGDLDGKGAGKGMDGRVGDAHGGPGGKSGTEGIGAPTPAKSVAMGSPAGTPEDVGGNPAIDQEALNDEERPPEKQMTDGKTALEEEVREKSLTPAGQRSMVAREHALKVQELTKSTDVRVGTPDHPYMMSSMGDVDSATESLLKSEFYVGPAPTLTPPGTVMRKSVMCKSEACGVSYPAFYTACPECGHGSTVSRLLPRSGFIGGGGEMTLQKSSNDPMLRPVPVEADVMVGELDNPVVFRNRR